MSDCKPIPDEKGFVLVLALLITTILLLMVVTLSYKADSYMRIFASTKAKTQTYYTSIAGSEQLRNYLWINAGFPEGCDPGNTWCGLLSTDPTNSRYFDRTAQITGGSSPLFGGEHYTIYFRDNEDGDGTPALDSDQLVLASVVSQNSTTGESTAIEAMLIYQAPAYSGQAGMGASKGNRAGGLGPGTANKRQSI